MPERHPPHQQARSPHHRPTGVGRGKRAFKGDDNPAAPLAPPVRRGNRTLQKEGEKRNCTEGPLFRSSGSRALREYPYSGGASGARHVEAPCNDANARPTVVGRRWGEWGGSRDLELEDPSSSSRSGASWFCPVWFDWHPQPVEQGTGGGAPWTFGEPPPIGTLPSDRADWPADWLDLFEERAALIEYHGGLPRRQAEDLAEHRVRLEAIRAASAWPRETAAGELSESSSPRPAGCRNLLGRGDARPVEPTRAAGCPGEEWASPGPSGPCARSA